MTSASTSVGYDPLTLKSRPLAWKVAAVAIGTLLLAAASYIEVPMVPVPVTMQTFAVTLIGALYGWRLGAITVAAWLVEGALGLPVLSGGAGGLVHFMGPTGGYLFSFPVVAALTGWLAERGWNGGKVWLAFVAMLAGNGLCLVLGAAWLSMGIGIEQGIEYGVTPFLIGGVLKSALAAASLLVVGRVKRQA
jgi:biotin transport system substrate-specific component